MHNMVLTLRKCSLLSLIFTMKLIVIIFGNKFVNIHILVKLNQIKSNLLIIIFLMHACYSHTFSELLTCNVVPIVNTNDAVVSPNEPDNVHEKQSAPDSTPSSVSRCCFALQPASQREMIN